MPAEPKHFMWVQSDEEKGQSKMDRVPNQTIKKSNKRMQQIQQLPKKKALVSSNSASSTSNAQSPNPQQASIASIEDYAPKVSQFYRNEYEDEKSDE